MKRVIVALSLAVAFAFASAARADNPARKACTDAMNADPMFANEIIKVANADTEYQHEHAFEMIQRNEQHVVMAYAAMWIAAVGFLLFLWKRQQALKGQIARLSGDLEKALAAEPKADPKAKP